MSAAEEPLLESAPLARQLARQLCRIDPATGDSCAWIHGFWPYLRLLGLASTPELHARFFVDKVRACVSGVAQPRVLISGAADFSMLSLAIRAFREQGITPDITVVDQCETPLRLNNWYAERAGIRIATVCRSIFDFEETGGFDAVCTHSFFSEIPYGRWPDLLARWRQLLRPGGVAVTVNRVRSGDVAGPVGFTPAQADAFRAAVLEKARSLGSAWQADLLELAGDAETYMARRRTYPIRSREEIAPLLESAGFTLDSLACGPVASGVRHDVSGPTTPGSADYARIVAHRS